MYLVGCIIATILTTLAIIIIFDERFIDGAWFYIILTPLLYFIFTYYRKNLGKPELISERLGIAISSSTFPQASRLAYYQEGVFFKHILVPLDQSPTAELALSCAQTVARSYAGTIHLLTVLCENNDKVKGKSIPISEWESANEYLSDVKADLTEADYKTIIHIKKGKPAEEIGYSAAQDIDLLIMTMHHGESIVHRWIVHSITLAVIHQTTPPLIVLRPTETWRSIRTRFKKLLVTLDGSSLAEQILPYAKAIASRLNSEVAFFADLY